MEIGARLPKPFDRFTSPFREFGLMAGSLYVLDRLLRRISRHAGMYVYELMVQPISDEPLLSPSLTRDLVFREIRPGDVELDIMPARPEIKESRFRQNAVCLGAFRKGSLIGYIWFCYDRYQEDEVRCTYVLPANNRSVFDFDLYVLPEHRFGIAFVAIWHGATQYLRERGIQFTFSRLTRFNTASRRSHAHLGWKRVGMAVFLKFGTAEFMMSTVSPHMSISLSERRRPRLGLRPDVLVHASRRLSSRG